MNYRQKLYAKAAWRFLLLAIVMLWMASAIGWRGTAAVFAFVWLSNYYRDHL